MHNRTSSSLVSLIFCLFNLFKRCQPLWASVSIKLASSFDIHPSNLQKHISLGWRQGSLVSPYSQDISLRSRILSIFPLFFSFSHFLSVLPLLVLYFDPVNTSHLVTEQHIYSDKMTSQSWSWPWQPCYITDHIPALFASWHQRCAKP